MTFNAGQMIHFMNISTLIMEPFVPDNAAQLYPFWKSWLLKRQLHVMMLSWCFTVSDVENMDKKLQEQQDSFLSVLEYMFLWRPKQHVSEHKTARVRKGKSSEERRRRNAWKK